MVQLDWKKLSAVSPEELTEDEKDDLYETLIWYRPEADVDAQKLHLLFGVVQEILKYKGSQVESLITELDDLATQQGKDEAETHRALYEEIQDLQAQLVQYQATKVQHTDVVGNVEIEEFQQALVQAQLHNEELVMKMKALEKDLLAEKHEVEKYASQVVTLEQEKVDLRRELSAVQNELSEQFEATLRQGSPELTAEKHRELVEAIRQKNKHISQLLNDVECVERENELLREKLVSLRDELAEATKQMTEAAGELASVKLTCVEQEEKLAQSGEEILALRTHVKELVEQKLQRDAQLDHFSEALDARVHKWKRVLEEKDAVIEELQSRLSLTASQAQNIQIDMERSKMAVLMQALQKREDQIDMLREQLENATKEMEKSTALIEQLKSTGTPKKKKISGVDAETLLKLKSQLHEAEKKNLYLEKKLKSFEEDAEVKDKERTEMIVRLRQYENGEYGLVQAVDEIKELRGQLQVREKYIQQLVQEGNQLQVSIDTLEEQNLALREKLGMSVDDEVPTDIIMSRRKREKLLMQVLQQQSERLQEEKLQLHLKNRNLVKEMARLQRNLQRVGDGAESMAEMEVVDVCVQDKQLVAVDASKAKLEAEHSQMAGNIALDQNGAVDDEDHNLNRAFAFLEEKLRTVTKENEAIRVGMHEILDSVRSQDGSSDVHLESKCLERLLEALDARHISGWYHPAMRLQAQVHVLEGNNAALREQFRALRLEEAESRKELQRAQLRAKELESMLAAQSSSSHAVYHKVALPPDMSLSSTELIAQLNSHLLRVLNEFNQELEKNKVLKAKVDDFGKNYNILRHQQGLLYEHYNEEKATWEDNLHKLEKDKLSLRDTVEQLQSTVDELDSNLTAIAAGGDETRRQLVESARRAADFRENKTQLERKVQVLQENNERLGQEKEKLNMQIIEMESTVTARISELTRQKEMLLFEVKSLQTKLQESVPLHVLKESNKRYADLVAKYRDLLQNEQILLCEKQYSERLQVEIDILQSNKRELEHSLQEAKEKLHAQEAVLLSLGHETVTKDTHDDQIAMFSQKLAALEIQQTHEKQKTDHAEKMFKILKEQIGQLEERNAYMESCNANLLKENAVLQQEKDLHNSLSITMDHHEIQQVKDKCVELEKELLVLRQERDCRQELADVARRQVHALEMCQSSKELQLTFMKRQILDLQATSDEKTTIGRLGHEVLASKLAEMAAAKNSEHLKSEVTRLKTVVLKQESRLDEKEREFSQLRSKLTSCCRSFQQLLLSARQQCMDAAGSLGQQQHAVLVHQCLREQQGLRERTARAERLAHDSATQVQELQLQARAMEELRAELEAQHGLGPLLDWHSRLTELQLKDLRSQRKVEFMELQLKQVEEKASKQDEYISMLETEQANLKKNWEQAQLMWQEALLSASQEKIEHTTVQDSKMIKHSKDSNGYTNNGTEPPEGFKEQLQQAMCLVGNQVQSLLKYEAELIQLKEKVTLLSRELKVKDDLLQKKDSACAELHSEPAKLQEIRVESVPPESQDKLALKVTVESLQTIVNQKEETICQYQNLLKDARTEHTEASAKLQEELQVLQMTLATQEQECNRLKSRCVGSLQPSLVVVEKYVKRNQELEEEVAELQTVVGQVAACRHEADRWRRLAEDRLYHMSELRHRLDEQHCRELQTYQEEARSCREERDVLKQQLISTREELAEKSEELEHSHSGILKNAVAILKAQLHERDTKIKQLSQTLLTTQNELKKHVKAEKTLSDDDKQERTKLKAQLASCLEENKKLKEQLNIRQQRPSRRDTSVERRPSAVEEDLRKRVVELEEKLKERTETDKAAEAKCIKSAEEVARWDERKKWQQTVEKCKLSEKEKINEAEKLQKTVLSLKAAIARIEKEKNVLCSRLKTAKGADSSQLEKLELENCKLETEVATLRSKLEIQQRHSTGLGKVFLEERLEAQEHRIAALELARKGNMVLVDELQKAKEANAVLEKANLRLESENLELRLDLEHMPKLKERVQYLEKYISILKEENSAQQKDPLTESKNQTEAQRGIGELQKTIIMLKKVVEKLQAENKRLKEIQDVGNPPSIA